MGAFVRHARLERHEGAFTHLPLLRRSLVNVTHPVIRNHGTTVGSLAPADPAGEMPSVLALSRGMSRWPPLGDPHRGGQGLLPRPARRKPRRHHRLLRTDLRHWWLDRHRDLRAGGPVRSGHRHLDTLAPLSGRSPRAVRRRSSLLAAPVTTTSLTRRSLATMAGAVERLHYCSEPLTVMLRLMKVTVIPSLALVAFLGMAGCSSEPVPTKAASLRVRPRSHPAPSRRPRSSLQVPRTAVPLSLRRTVTELR
jgi:hypothetical protein